MTNDDDLGSMEVASCRPTLSGAHAPTVRIPRASCCSLRRPRAFLFPSPALGGPIPISARVPAPRIPSQRHPDGPAGPPNFPRSPCALGDVCEAPAPAPRAAPLRSGALSPHTPPPRSSLLPHSRAEPFHPRPARSLAGSCEGDRCPLPVFCDYSFHSAMLNGIFSSISAEA